MPKNSSKSSIKKVVLAYSGGLDTSVIVKWLKETYDAEIVTFAALYLVNTGVAEQRIVAVAAVQCVGGTVAIDQVVGHIPGAIDGR